MHLTCVVGARPNFVKVAAILEAAAQRSSLQTSLIHTGQHYDVQMSALFFDELKLPKPDVYLGVGAGSHASQTARVMLQFDAALDEKSTDLVLVVGDVNSTLACALVAAKRLIPVAHVEAGLRSRDRTMPEEINRILTDQVSDWLFTTERTAADNLRAEGVDQRRIHFVGNVMIDTLHRHLERARTSDVVERMGLQRTAYALSTLHRPANVDNQPAAMNTVLAIEVLAQRLVVVLPLHPRTRNRLAEFKLLERLVDSSRVRVTEPLGYLEFLALMERASLVFTDSGGVQEETTALEVPCLTFRENTERPITITEGSNRLVGSDPAAVAAAADDVLGGTARRGRVPELWDGRASQRILDTLLNSSNRYSSSVQ